MVHHFCHFPASILTILALLNFQYAPLAKTQSQSSQTEKPHSSRKLEYHKGKKKKNHVSIYVNTNIFSGPLVPVVPYKSVQQWKSVSLQDTSSISFMEIIGNIIHFLQISN